MKRNVITAIVFALAVSSFHAFATEEKADDYPLTTCVVSGDDLGEMGEAYIYQYEGREVRFCCKMCKKDFLKDPTKYLAKLDKAAAGSEEKSLEGTGEKSDHHMDHDDYHDHDDKGIGDSSDDESTDHEAEHDDAHEHHHHDAD